MPSKYGFTTPEEERQWELQRKADRREMERREAARIEARRQEEVKLEGATLDIGKDLEQTTGKKSPIVDVSVTYAPAGRGFIKVELDSEKAKQLSPQQRGQIGRAFKTTMGTNYSVEVWDPETDREIAESEARREREHAHDFTPRESEPSSYKEGWT